MKYPTAPGFVLAETSKIPPIFPGTANRLIYEFGPFRLDPAEQSLRRDGRRVPLRPKVFGVLCALVERHGRLVDKDTLLTEIWPDSYVDEASLSRSISVLRKALCEDVTSPQYIETVPKRGYRFIAAVVEIGVVADDADATMLAAASSRPTWRRPVQMAGAIGAVLGVVALVGYARFSWPDAQSAAADPGIQPPLHRQVTFTGGEGFPTLSPDGERIGYVSSASARQTVTVQTLAGGAAHAVFTSPEAARLRWSPDGSELLVWARGDSFNGLYRVAESGGEPRRIAAGQFVGTWSPDGSTIAIAQYLASRIAFVDRDGHQRRTIVIPGSHQWFWDLDWSARTNRLAFVSNDDAGRHRLWTMLPDGSQLTEVHAEATEMPSARWSPDGSAIYFFLRRKQTMSLFKIAVDPANGRPAGGPVPLITGLESDGAFALSADGRHLVYARAPFHSNLWLVDLDRAGQPIARELTHGTSHVERPRFSPDGKSVVFNMGDESLSNIYTLPVSGGEPRPLTSFPAFSAGASWSPDGKAVAFVSNAGGKLRVWTVSAGGGEPRAISSGQVSDTFEVTWFPDGRLLYQQAGNRNYYVLDPRTSAEHLLVDNSQVGWLFSPVLSPDRTRIAVAWNRRPDRGIWIIDNNGANQRPAYVSNTVPWPLQWSAEGRVMYALEGKRSLYRGQAARVGESLTGARVLSVSLDGASSSTLVDLPFEEVGGVDVAADGRRLVCVVYTSHSDVWVVENFDSTHATNTRLAAAKPIIRPQLFHSEKLSPGVR